MKFTAVMLAAVFCLNVHAASEDGNSDEAIVRAAETLIQEDAAATSSSSTKANATEASSSAASNSSAATTASTSSATAADSATQKPATASTKESDIPVFLDSKKVDLAGSNVWWRLLASLVLIAAVGGVLVFASRRWTRKKDKGGNKARIELLHQFHMGPRKSLALVRVSGEALLVGVTDQNINMLKPVTLIDDELEGLMNKDFNNFLEDEFSVEDVRSALDSRV